MDESTTARCKCKKNGNYCGPGCKCVRCSNLQSSVSTDPHTAIIEAEEKEAESGSDTEYDLESEVDKIMNDVFGVYDSNEVQSYTETDNDSDTSSVDTALM